VSATPWFFVVFRHTRSASLSVLSPFFCSKPLLVSAPPWVSCSTAALSALRLVVGPLASHPCGTVTTNLGVVSHPSHLCSRILDLSAATPCVRFTDVFHLHVLQYCNLPIKITFLLSVTPTDCSATSPTLSAFLTNPSTKTPLRNENHSANRVYRCLYATDSKRRTDCAAPRTQPPAPPTCRDHRYPCQVYSVRTQHSVSMKSRGKAREGGSCKYPTRPPVAVTAQRGSCTTVQVYTPRCVPHNRQYLPIAALPPE
jgi:hypothetical protein